MRKLSTKPDDERLAYYEKLSQSIAEIAASSDPPDVKTCKLLERIASQLLDLSMTVDHVWLGLTSLHHMIENMDDKPRKDDLNSNKIDSKVYLIISLKAVDAQILCLCMLDFRNTIGGNR